MRKIINSAHKLYFAALENIIFISAFVCFLSFWLRSDMSSDVLLCFTVLCGAISVATIVMSVYWVWTGKLCVIAFYSDRLEYRKHFKKEIIRADALVAERVSVGEIALYMKTDTGIYTLFNSIRKIRALAYMPYFLAIGLRDKQTGKNVIVDFTSLKKLAGLTECETTSVASAAKKGIIEYRRCSVQFASKYASLRKRAAGDRFAMNVASNRVLSLFVYIMSALVTVVILIGMIISVAEAPPSWEGFVAIGSIGLGYALLIFVLYVIGAIKYLRFEDDGATYRKHLLRHKIAYDELNVQRSDNLKALPCFEFKLSDAKSRKIQRIRLSAQDMRDLLPYCENTAMHDALSSALKEWDENVKASVFCED